MSKQILILPGDGIGPEIMAEAVKVLELANSKYSLGFELSHDVIGGAAIDKHGVPLADETLDRARAADAVLLGAVGGPRENVSIFSFTKSIIGGWFIFMSRAELGMGTCGRRE